MSCVCTTVSWKYECEVLYFFFFFQAEDGIRDYKVTGVQTCALPIYWSALNVEMRIRAISKSSCARPSHEEMTAAQCSLVETTPELGVRCPTRSFCEIGRASCRERV